MVRPKMIRSRLKLCYITDRNACPVPLEEAVEGVLEAGFTAVQLREKDLCPREFLALAERIRPVVQRAGAALIINSSVETALAVDADGVHLSYTALPANVARRLLPPGKLVGVSAHNIEEALAAQRLGADYISLSPIFQTPSKRGIVPTLGLEGIEAVASQLRLPVIALGGITADNARACLEAGAAGVAIKSRAFSAGEDFMSTAAAIAAAVRE
ncbi:MAG: thiamine phosphate synthase [Candidatus Sumerlaeia bacterium]